MEGSKTLFCSSKSPKARERIFFFVEIYSQLGTLPQKFPPTVAYANPFYIFKAGLANMRPSHHLNCFSNTIQQVYGT